VRAAVKERKRQAGPSLDGLIGWQGITARVPADWNLGALGGDGRTGYVRVDDERMPRLEVKWSSAQNVNTDRVLTRYLTQLGKTSRQDTIAVARDTRVVSRRQQPTRKSLECFSWRGQRQQGHGVIWYCPQCRRTVIAQVRGGPQEDLLPLAGAVLSSLEDHGRDGWYTWALYGLAVEVPREFELARQQLMAGYLDLQFEWKGRRLRVQRWGMAEMALAERDLEHWVELEYVKRRDVRWRLHPLAGEAHPSLELEGECRRPFHWLRKVAAGLVRLRPPIFLSGKVWHCAASNRIYAVEEVHKEGDERWPRVAASIACH